MAQITNEYASALFALASEKNAKKEYEIALETINSVFDGEPQYIEFLYSPSIEKSIRLDSIDKAFKEIVPEDVLSFVKILCEKGRIKDFCEISDEYKTLVAVSEGVMHATITSAIELTDTEKQKIVSKLEQSYKKEVVAKYFVDSSIIGGIIIDIDGKIIDASIKGRLYDIKEVIDK